MIKNGLLLVLLIFVAIFTVTSCLGIILGSGDVVTETRHVSNYDQIVLRGQGVVIITQDGEESLSIESNPNILELVEAEVVDGTLELGLQAGVNILSNNRLTFNVSVDNLSSVGVAGSGEIELERIETDRLETTTGGSGSILVAELTADAVEVKINGSGEINLAGNAAEQDITISGSGGYLGGDLCSGSVSVSINGSGDATVCATEMLDTNIKGGGSVGYYGQPSVNIFGDGSGEINSLGEK